MARFGEEIRGDDAAAVTPRSHHEWASRMWRRMDRDQSENITRQELDCEEFRSLIKAVLAPGSGSCMGGPRYARAQLNMEQAVNFFLRKADLNNDGTISYKEFKALTMCLRQPHLAQFTGHMIFAMFDVNTDSRISEEEFREIYRFYLGHIPTEADFQEEWGRLDTGGNGEVTREEYIDWLRRSPNPIFHQHAPMTEDVTAGGDFGSSKSSGFSMTKTSSMAMAAQNSWRPWDSYSHMGWDQRAKKNQDGSQSSTSKASTAGLSVLHKNLRKSDTMQQLPKWNQNLCTANPNWIDNADAVPRKHKNARKYFSRPQSLPELKRYYNTHSGCKDLLERAELPQTVEQKRKAFLSHEFADAGPELLPNRSKRRGQQRHKLTGAPRKWDEFWQPPAYEAKMYQPSTIAYKCPGPPPRHLYADLYEEDEA